MVASVIMMSWQIPSSSSTTKARGVADPRLPGAAGPGLIREYLASTVLLNSEFILLGGRRSLGKLTQDAR